MVLVVASLAVVPPLVLLPLVLLWPWCLLLPRLNQSTAPAARLSVMVYVKVERAT